jgi:hypothetical protein
VRARGDSLDISWLKDDSAEDAADLPEPAVLAREAVEELNGALAELEAIYLYHFLRSSEVQSRLREGSSQTTNIANISVGRLSELPVPLAPWNEQNRIADKLDTVLNSVDKVNARLARVTPILKRFRQSVLAAATSGKLTEEWRGRGERLMGRRICLLDGLAPRLPPRRAIATTFDVRSLRPSGAIARDRFPTTAHQGPSIRSMATPTKVSFCSLVRMEQTFYRDPSPSPSGPLGKSGSTTMRTS